MFLAAFNLLIFFSFSVLVAKPRVSQMLGYHWAYSSNYMFLLIVTVSFYTCKYKM